jgi:hypothetical protein
VLTAVWDIKIRQCFHQTSYPTIWKFLNAVGSPQKRPQYRATRGFVSTQVSIDVQGGFGIVMVF